MAALVLGLAALGAVSAGCTDRTVYMRIDRGVHYTDVRVGKGAGAQPGDFIELHYTAKLPDGKRIADTRENGRSHQFTVGDGSVIRGLDAAVRGMRVGGVRRITVLPDSHVGRDGYGALVPPHTPMIFEVEMLRVAQAPPPVRSPLTSAAGR
jgi:FKBP-type peptidyl-prolyl cis-trans isomerase